MGLLSGVLFGTCMSMYPTTAGDIDKEVHLTFSRKCVDMYYDEVRHIWFTTSLDKYSSIILTKQKWKENGQWDKCIHERN